MPATLYALDRPEVVIMPGAQRILDHSISMLSREDYSDAYRFGKGFRRMRQSGNTTTYALMEETWKDMIGPNNLDWEQVEEAVLDGYFGN